MILQDAAPPPAAAATCDSTSALTLAMSLQAIKLKDPKTAEGLIDGEFQRCPAGEPMGRTLRVLRADLASEDGDWAGARGALGGVERPRGILGVNASFTAMRADAGLKDADAFARERAALAEAVDAALAGMGRRVERFDASGFAVTGYETPVVQSGFARRVEFVIAASAPFAYPRTVMLTDDLRADKGAAELAAKDPLAGRPPGLKTWFVDLYTCNLHVTLKQLQTPVGTPPTYADVKPLVTAYLAGPGEAEGAPPPESVGACPSAAGLSPGVG